MLTILKYRYQLDERHTGLSSNIMYRITQGIEWVGDWAMRSYPISISENDLIVTHDVDEVMKFTSDV